MIDKLIPGGAADKQGELKVGDRMVSVGQGDDGEMVDVAEMKLNDVVQLIRGRAGTIVRLGVTSPAGGDVEDHQNHAGQDRAERQRSPRPRSSRKARRPTATPFKIGVIDLPSFYMDMTKARDGTDDFKICTRDVQRILDDFNTKGVDAVVLDLRRNGGGSLTEAINLTGLFIEDGPVVQVKDPDGRVQQYDDTDRGIAWKGPLVVMTSKFSASASEILAGAIQDYHRGLIIGDSSTHGKGTVQTMVDLGPQLFRISQPAGPGSLKLTVQQFYRPSGDSTQQRGVLADITLPSITDHMDVAEGDLDYPVAFDKVPGRAVQQVRQASRRTWSARSRTWPRSGWRSRMSSSKLPEGHRALPGAEGEEGSAAERAEVHGPPRRARRRQGRGEDLRAPGQRRRRRKGLQAQLLQQRSAQHHARLPEAAGQGQGRASELSSKNQDPRTKQNDRNAPRGVSVIFLWCLEIAVRQAASFSASRFH